MHDIQQRINQWLQDGQAIALATVIQTWGSSPRKAGAKMGVTRDTAMVGSVSGGCVETAVIEEALKVLKSGQPKVLHFEVSDDTAWSVGLACGGSLSVFVEPLDTSWWQMVSQRHDERLTTLVDLETGDKRVVDTSDTVLYESRPLPMPDDVRQTGRITLNARDLFIDVHRPQPRLVIIGGAHVAMALHTMAAVLGFRIIVVDPRRAFATESRFPLAEAIHHAYPDKVLPNLRLDGDTYLVVLSHDDKIDDPALKVALPAPLAYIGVMSSRRTHIRRVERLKAAGISEEQLARIHTPIGINIGAQTPEEIAVSILAEIVAVRNQRN